MKRKSILLLLFLGCYAWAHEPSRGALHGSFGPYLFRSHNFNSQAADNATWTGFTLAAEGDVDNHGGLEIGITYFQHPYARRYNGLLNVEKVKRIYVTMGYRHWFSRDFSSALAFYSAYSMGDPQVMSTDFPMNARPDSSAEDIAEYGFDFSLQWEFYRHERFSTVLDGRYSYSVTSKAQEDGNHYGLLLSVKYLIQDKEKGVMPP
jgi:hypothetical protein